MVVLQLRWFLREVGLIDVPLMPRKYLLIAGMVGYRKILFARKL
jgi:hypothetical protein